MSGAGHLGSFQELWRARAKEEGISGSGMVAKVIISWGLIILVVLYILSRKGEPK